VPDSPIETLLDVQAHDTAVDRLRHRLNTLAERDELVAAEARMVEVDGRLGEVGGRRGEVDAQERRLGDEVATIAAKAGEVEKSMYSGKIGSPRELQAMQADIEQLRRHQRTVEDREIEAMEAREALDEEMSGLEAARSELGATVERLRASVAEQEQAIDAELRAELATRDAVAGALPAEIVATYEKCRTDAGGIGVARLVGMTCQSCHLTIPSTEVDRMRREAHGGGVTAIAFCDNCGAMLVFT